MSNSLFKHHTVSIEPVAGGYVLTYPVIDGDKIDYEREVFVTQRKLTTKIKEVLEVISGVPDDGKTE